MHETLRKAFNSLPQAPGSVVDFDLKGSAIALDLSKDNVALRQAWQTGDENLEPHIWAEIERLGGSSGVGGYGEDRRWYSRNAAFFEGEEARTIHLGVDIWVPVATPVLAPLHSRVHSFADNAAVGDYGPTVILEHNVEGIRFHTLYGHLSRESLSELSKGMEIKPGQSFATVGGFEVNGCWPVHLHFQLVVDMEGKIGDYPGVAAPSQLEHYFSNCPDPNLILCLDCLRP